MSATEDGGPAFAVPRPHTDAGTGISKRDLFALHAVGACFAQAIEQSRKMDFADDIHGYAKRSAFWAYAIADAMLEARKRK